MEAHRMLKFVLDHLKTKKMCTNAVKKLQFVIKYPDCFETKQICDKNYYKNAAILMLAPGCYKDQKMWWSC